MFNLKNLNLKINARQYFFYNGSIGGGSFIPIQVALNALLGRYVGEPMQVTFVSYLAGTLTSLLVCILARYSLPSLAALNQTAWWMWVGGCLGTLYVWATILTSLKLGATLTLAITFAGQMAASLFLDHFGYLGLTKYEASPTRILGVLVTFMGVSLVAYAKR